MKRFLLLLLLLPLSGLAFDGDQRDSCDCKDFRYHYMADSIAEGPTDTDTMYCIYVNYGNDDSTNWHSSEEEIDFFYTVMNEEFASYGLYFKGYTLWVNNTEMRTAQAQLYQSVGMRGHHSVAADSQMITWGGWAVVPAGILHTLDDSVDTYDWGVATGGGWRESVHETGHYFGLFHTHRGVVTDAGTFLDCNETDPLRENPHDGETDSINWLHGDMCLTEPCTRFTSVTGSADTLEYGRQDTACTDTYYHSDESYVRDNYMQYTGSAMGQDSSDTQSFEATQLAMMRCWIVHQPIYNNWVVWVNE